MVTEKSEKNHEMTWMLWLDKLELAMPPWMTNADLIQKRDGPLFFSEILDSYSEIQTLTFCSFVIQNGS